MNAEQPPPCDVAVETLAMEETESTRPNESPKRKLAARDQPPEPVDQGEGLGAPPQAAADQAEDARRKRRKLEATPTDRQEGVKTIETLLLTVANTKRDLFRRSTDASVADQICHQFSLHDKLGELTRAFESALDFCKFAERHQPTPFPLALGYFCVVPYETLLDIFSFLEARDLCNVRTVCGLFNSLSSEESLWRLLAIREIQVVPNRIHARFGKNWEWVYRSHNVPFNRKEKNAGIGFFRFDNNHWYAGEWKDGSCHGYGVDMRDDVVYEGEWRDGEQSGYGRATWSYTGDEYEGEWLDYDMNGEGRCRYSNGDVYVGQWKDSERNGEGVCAYADGHEYKGSWREDLQTGNGVMKYPDGRQYNGQWKNGRRHGQGVLQWPSGVRYVGEWKKDAMLGGRCQLVWPEDDAMTSLEEGLTRFNMLLGAQGGNAGAAAALPTRQ